MTETSGVSRLREIVRELRDQRMQCNCDLDNWEPEPNTGHSWVCRIHKAAILKLNEERRSR